MATAMDSSCLEVSFRSLVHHIAIKLTPQNCSSLTFLYGTTNHIREQDIPGLEILKELVSKRKFTYLCPQELEEAMIKIERQDLAELVKRYRKSDEFKHALKLEKSKAKNKSCVDKKSMSYSKESSPMASVAFIHAAHIVLQTKSFLVAVTTEDEQQHKKEVAAVTKDFDKLIKSLKSCHQAIMTSKETQPPAEPAPEVPSLEHENKHTYTHFSPPPLCSPVSCGSAALTESYSSSASSKSEEENPPKDMDNCTGDSGYNGSGSDNSWITKLPTAMKKRKGKNEDPDYENPWPVQETEYEKLNLHTKDKPHHYANYKK